MHTFACQVAFLDAIRRHNAWVVPHALRSYQAGVLRGDGLSIISPIDGRLVEMQGSYLIASDVIAYEFCSGEFYLVVGAQHEGYPLAFLLYRSPPQTCRIIDDGDAPHIEVVPDAVGEPWVLAIDRLRPQRPLDGRIHALFGDGNFAHLAWNALGALDVLQTMPLDPERIRFISRCDPMGDPRLFFDSLGWMDLVGWDEVPELHPGCKFENATFLGANRVTARVADAVLKASRLRASASCRADLARLGESGKKVIWISLRRRQRDCLNQVEFVAEFVSRLLQATPAALILDGFSYPDCAVPDFFDDYRRHVDEELDRLLGRCPPLRALVEAGDAVVLNGCSIYDSVLMASAADFYVCHGGTQQHKIAWFHPIPGVIHLPNPSESVESWYADQSEVARRPRCIPSSMIHTEDSEQIRLQDRAYRIDVHPAVAFTLDVALKHLAHNRP